MLDKNYHRANAAFLSGYLSTSADDQEVAEQFKPKPAVKEGPPYVPPKRVGTRRVIFEILDEEKGIAALWYDMPEDAKPKILWREQEKMVTEKFKYSGPQTPVPDNWPEYLFISVPAKNAAGVAQGGNLRNVLMSIGPRPPLAYALRSWDESPDTMVTIIRVARKTLDGEFSFDPTWPGAAARFTGYVPPESVAVFGEQVEVYQPPQPPGLPGQPGPGDAPGADG